MNRSLNSRWLVAAGLLTAVCTAHVQARGVDDLVADVDKSPVSSDGTTAGRATDFVINLRTSMAPDVDGRTLLEGRTIRVTLPDAFRESAGYAFSSIGPGCAPPLGSARCNTAVLLQGWPQHPIAPPAMKYDFGYEPATNTVVYTAREDLVPAAPAEPGIKQLHLLLLGFTNPRPGHYRLKIEAETGPGGALERGWATVRILPASRPSINVTSTGNDNPTTLNTIYQEATVGNTVPLNYNFLLWNRDDEPFGGIDLFARKRDGRYFLKRDGKVVGKASIDAPDGAVGQALVSFGESVVTTTPVIGTMTARWTGRFVAGSEPGLYTVSVELHGGNEVKMYVNAVER